MVRLDDTNTIDFVVESGDVLHAVGGSLNNRLSTQYGEVKIVKKVGGIWEINGQHLEASS